MSRWRPKGCSADDFIDPPGFIGWTMRHGFKSAPPIANLLMRAATISMDPNKHRSLTDILIVPEMKGIELRDWKEYEAAVEAGYNDMKAGAGRREGPAGADHSRQCGGGRGLTSSGVGSAARFRPFEFLPAAALLLEIAGGDAGIERGLVLLARLGAGGSRRRRRRRP